MTSEDHLWANLRVYEQWTDMTVTIPVTNLYNSVLIAEIKKMLKNWLDNDLLIFCITQVAPIVMIHTAFAAW